MILASLLQVIYFTLVPVLFVGRVRSRIMLPFLPYRLSIKALSMQLQRLFGYNISWRSLVLIYQSLPFFIVTIRVLLRSLGIQFSINRQSTSRFICTTLES